MHYGDRIEKGGPPARCVRGTDRGSRIYGYKSFVFSSCENLTSNILVLITLETVFEESKIANG